MEIESWQLKLIYQATKEEWRRKSVSIDKFTAKGLDVSIRRELVKSYAIILEKLEREMKGRGLK